MLAALPALAGNFPCGGSVQRLGLRCTELAADLVLALLLLLPLLRPLGP